MSFDFKAYLRTIDPTQNYTIQQLFGGVVNITARATKRVDPATGQGRFPGHDSLVLKYATPFVAAVGESAPLTLQRQATEAKALALFGPGLPLSQLQAKADVEVPELLHYDSDSHVLVLADLGQLFSLSEVFGSLGGWVPMFSPPSSFSTVKKSGIKDSTVDDGYHLSSIGFRLGKFFGHMHSRRLLQDILENPQLGQSYLSNAEIQDNVLEHVIKPIESRLNRFADIVPDALNVSKLCQRIESSWMRTNVLNEDVSIALGDCWTGSVLVSALAESSVDRMAAESMHPSKPKVCVIDFEFASLGRGAHGDVPQLMAHLECFLIMARYHHDSGLIQDLELLISSFIDMYRLTSTSEKAVWLAKRDDEAGKAPHPRSIRARVARSAILAMATEVMNVAYWKVWPCKNKQCPGLPATEAKRQTVSRLSGSEGGESNPPATKKPPFDTTLNDLDEAIPPLHDEHKLHLCPPIRIMVQLAIWLIERAGEDEEGLCEAQNWNELVFGPPGWFGADKEDRRRWLLDLFT